MDLNDPPPTEPAEKRVWAKEQLRVRIARRPRNAPHGQSLSQGVVEPSSVVGSVQEIIKVSKNEGGDKPALDQSSDVSKVRATSQASSGLCHANLPQARSTDQVFPSKDCSRLHTRKPRKNTQGDTKIRETDVCNGSLLKLRR